MSEGSYALEQEGPYRVPVFTFFAQDLPGVERLLADEVVHFEVRRRDGLFTYYLVIPDLALPPRGIPVSPADLLHVATGQGIRGGITTRVADAQGASLSLDAFTRGIKHDWSGLHDQARLALEQLSRGVSPSEQLERPLRNLRSALADLDAHEIDGHLIVARWLALRGDAAAFDAYSRAIQGGRPSWTDPAFVPAAAEPLAALGLAYAEHRMVQAARVCFEHALHLRPRHASARRALASILGAAPEAVDIAALRADVSLRSHDRFTERLDALA